MVSVDKNKKYYLLRRPKNRILMPFLGPKIIPSRQNRILRTFYFMDFAEKMTPKH